MLKKKLLFGLLISQLVNLPVLSETNQEISIFKNNISFVKKEIYNNTKESKDIIIKDIPDALFGTISFLYDNGKIDSITSENFNVSEQTDVKNLTELIEANINKNIKLTLTSGEVFDVKIHKIQGDLLFCNHLTKSEDLVLNINSVKFVAFENNLYSSKINKENKKRVIKINSNDKPKKIDMIYMQKGLGWIPSYRLILEDKEKAKLTLEATLINDMENIENANVSLVIGYPNFIYSKYKSPFTSYDDLSWIFNDGSNYSYKKNYSYNMQNIASQSISNNDESDSDNSISTQNEDLYFYKLPKKLSIKKSDRAIFELFSNQIEYQDIYEGELENNLNKYNYYDKQSVKNKNEPIKVWHSIRIKNSAKTPFTTAPVMVFKNDNNKLNPISQDIINYTSVGNKTKVKLTLSPDILIKETDKEISRRENIKLADGNFYKLVTIESKINIKNSLNKEIKLNLSKIIEGDLLESNKKTNSSILNMYNNYFSYNKINKTEWEIPLKQDQSEEIVFKYSIYIR